MIVAGIDPGANGALALMTPDDLFVYDVPMVGKDVDEVAWATIWMPVLRRADHIWIEQVGAMPGQGVTSMFNFGQRFGFVKAMAYLAHAPVSFVRPQAWKAGVGITKGAEKGASRLRASQLFPKHADLWARVKDDGRAEAALISYYGANHRT